MPLMPFTQTTADESLQMDKHEAEEMAAKAMQKNLIKMIGLVEGVLNQGKTHGCKVIPFNRDTRGINKGL